MSYWKLDESGGARTDVLSRSNLADNNTVSSATGVINNGASFVAASSQYLNCSSNSYLQMSGNTDFTIAAWVKFNSVGSNQSIVSKDSNVSNSRDYNLGYNFGSALGFVFHTQSSGTLYIANGGFPASTGVWYFLVGWYDSSNGQAHLRINDATTYNSSTGATGPDASSAEFRIGARVYLGAEDYADATIDEVGVWKRLLTAGEITALYNGGAGITFTGFPAASLIVTRAVKFVATLFGVGGGGAGGIGTQLYTDDFNRADQNPIAGNWTASTGNPPYGMAVVSNTASYGTGHSGDDCEAFWNLWASGNDQYSQAGVTAGSSSADSGFGVSVRRSTTASVQTEYRAVMGNDGTIYLGKIVTGTYTQLATRSVTYSAGTKLGLAVQGTSLSIWYGGVQYGANVTDSAISTGSPGIAYSSSLTSGSLDNWDAGTTGATSVVAVLFKRTGKALGGTLSFVGAIAKKLVDGGFTASLSFAGAIAKRLLDGGFTATLSFVGSIASIKSFGKAFTATLSFSAGITRRVSKALSAALSFVGNLATSFIGGGGHLFTQSLSATLSFVGTINRRTAKVLSAILSFGAPISGKVWVSDGSAANTQSLINGASDGDIISIPAGTFTWATNVSITKGLTIQGAGTTSPLTKIVNSTTASSGLETPSFDIDLSSDKAVRITQIYFQDQSVDQNSAGVRMGWAGSILATKLRIDHCTFEGFAFAVKHYGIFGVCDHCYFLNNRISARNAGYSSTSALNGFTPVPPWGWDISKYFVFEDTTFELASWSSDTYMMDTEYPCNYMVRHCTFNINRASAVVADGFDMHGNAGTAVNPIGLVIHANTFNYTGNNTVNPCRLTDVRGGRYSLVYDNVVNGVDSYTTLRSDPAGSVAMTDTYLWNNVGQGGGAMTFDVQSGLIENTNYFKFTPSGFLGFTYPYPWPGSTTLARLTDHFLPAAVLSFIGNLTTLAPFVRAFTATLSFAGAIKRSSGKSLSATLNAAASLAKRVSHALGASLSFAGALIKAFRDAGFTATLSFVGNLASSAVHVFTRAFTATLSFVGALTRSRLFSRAFAATLSFAANVRRSVGKTLSATVSFTGIVTRRIGKALRATLSFTVTLFTGGAIVIFAGQVAGSILRLVRTGSSLRVTRTQSELDVEKTE